jgi:hypothetical protein
MVLAAVQAVEEETLPQELGLEALVTQVDIPQ